MKIMATFVKFKDFEDGICYGIKIGNCICCSCCGGTHEIDEVEIIETQCWENLNIEQYFQKGVDKKSTLFMF